MTPYLQDYMKLVLDTEPPKIFQLWSALSASSAVLGRNIWFEFGNNRIFPNLYVMLIGDAGSRKSSAIKLAKKLVHMSGYEFLAPGKSTREKFLLDFEQGFTYESDSGIGDDSLNELLDGDVFDENAVREVYIPADEWLAFFGEGNTSFATTLGDLWDYDDPKPYIERVKNSKSVRIPNPTVSILGGATHENFKLAFPANLLGHGFLSRMLLIYGERSSIRITWPPPMPDDQLSGVVQRLSSMRVSNYGPVKPDQHALEVLDEVYRNWSDLDDTRLQHYSTRRFTQLLKIALTLCGQQGKKVLERSDVIAANTILSFAEVNMGKALGEFGASKMSNVAHTILSTLDSHNRPVTSKELWKLVSRDLESPQQLMQIIQNLVHADKVMLVKDKGYLPKKAVRPVLDHLLDLSLLTPLLQESSIS